MFCIDSPILNISMYLGCLSLCSRYLYLVFSLFVFLYMSALNVCMGVQLLMSEESRVRRRRREFEQDKLKKQKMQKKKGSLTRQRSSSSRRNHNLLKCVSLLHCCTSLQSMHLSMYRGPSYSTCGKFLFSHFRITPTTRGTKKKD